jgi:pimeloyl-ACP methyl ester carboxylesterase
MPFVRSGDGTRIYTTDWGTGSPVVLIHGWPLNADSWDAQAHFLAEHGVRAVTYDRRGFGRSDKPWQGYDYDTLAGDLHAVIEGLGLTGVTLVGFSMGGGEVVRYLSRYGAGRVAKAVLVSSVTPCLLRTGDHPHGVEAARFEDDERQIREDRLAFGCRFGPNMYGRSAGEGAVLERQLEWTRSMGFTATTRAMVATLQSWSSTDFREEMKRIAIPVRVIHGTRDEVVPIEASGRMSAKLLPQATLSEYEGEPHGLFLTAAQRLSEELLGFVLGGARGDVGSGDEAGRLLELKARAHGVAC